MRTKYGALLSFSLLALALACQEATDVTRTPDAIPPGAMAYTGYDENGLAAVEGWVQLDLAIIAADPSVPSNVTGAWKLHRVGSGGEIGPQVGQGKLEGLLQDDQLFVNFNPDSTDDNVGAGGTLKVIGGPASGMSWEGTWIWSGFSGTRRTGTFRARS